MDKYQEKENVKRKSRIPLPRAPLPALPKHLLNKLSGRPPLNTLAGPNGHNHNAPTSKANTQSFAGPSTSRCQSLINRPKTPLKIDTNLVTVQRGCDESDYNFVAYQDDMEGNPERGGGRTKRRLNFDQTVRERMQPPDFLQKSYTASLNREYTADILTYLLQVETKPVSVPRLKSATRASVINWLMKINGLHSNPVTTQTAMWYLDAVLASGNATLANMQLLAAACYWIATKIHGPRTPSSKLVQYASHTFTAQMLVEAEEFILVRLKFPRQPVIPHDYLCYLAWWCNSECPGEIEVATTFICLCGMMVNKKLCREYPSVVAAASARNALLLLGKKELIPRLQSCPVFVEAEKKARIHSHPCVLLRNAVRVVAEEDYSSNFIFEQYGMPPKYVAQTIVSAANEFAMRDGYEEFCSHIWRRNNYHDRIN